MSQNINLNPKSVEEFQGFIPILEGNNFELKKQIIIIIRKQTSVVTNPPLQQIVEAEIVPFIINFHRVHTELDDQIKLDLLWIMTNICSGASTLTQACISLGVIDYFIEFMDSNNPELFYQALWGISNICGESYFYRDLILEKDVLTKIISFIQSHNFTFTKEGGQVIAWSFSNMCRFKPPVKFYLVKDCLTYVRTFLVSLDDPETIQDSLWTLSYITEISNIAIQEVCSQDFVPILAKYIIQEMVSQQKTKYITPALRALGNIVTGNDTDTQSVVDNGCIPLVVKLLTYPVQSVRKDACFLLSNVAAGTNLQIQSILDQHVSLFPSLTNIFQSQHQEVKNEALWIIGNIFAGGSLPQIILIIQSGLVWKIFDLFKQTTGLTTKFVNTLSNCLQEIKNFYVNLSDAQFKNQFTVQIIQNVIQQNILPYIEKIIQSYQNLKFQVILTWLQGIQSNSTNYNDNQTEIQEITNAFNTVTIAQSKKLSEEFELED